MCFSSISPISTTAYASIFWNGGFAKPRPQEKGWIVALLFYFLNQWNRRNTGLHPQGVGIPQDALADCSRLLANYYLQRHDKFAAELCEQANASYFRYADDQMILVRDTEGLETIMLLLTRNLDRYGLRVNQMKVKVWTVEELQKNRCRDIQAIFRQLAGQKEPETCPPIRRRLSEIVRHGTREDVESWSAFAQSAALGKHRIIAVQAV